MDAEQPSASLQLRKLFLQEKAAALEREAERVQRQREEIAAELADVTALCEEMGNEESLVANKRARPSVVPAVCRPRSWCYLSDVQSRIKAQRAAGELVDMGAPGRVPRVYVDGCFDMMHSGHMNAVRQAKLIADSVGGVLVVGVHTDLEIEANKGPPVMRDDERLQLVAAVKWVDELIFDTCVCRLCALRRARESGRMTHCRRLSPRPATPLPSTTRGPTALYHPLRILAATTRKM